MPAALVSVLVKVPAGRVTVAVLPVEVAAVKVCAPMATLGSLSLRKPVPVMVKVCA